MKSKCTKFSVVIPLYNKRKYIRRAVDSVLAQNFSDFELIVVDDGSTDGSEEQLQGVADNRLKIIRQVNMGAGPARNSGMGAANGNIIAFLDADDAWLPNHLEDLEKITVAFPEAGLLSTKCIETTASQLPNRPIINKKPNIRIVDYFLEASRNIGYINSTSAAIKQDVFEKLGGFRDSKVGEDLEYWARVALHYPVAVSNVISCVYYRDTRGVMHDLSKVCLMHKTEAIDLRSLSPSVAMICNYAEKDPSLWERHSIKAYINGRLESALRAGLYKGDICWARSLTKLMYSPVSPRQRLYKIIVFLPSFFLRVCVGTYVLLKRYYNKWIKSA